MTALFGAYSPRTPEGIDIGFHGAITPEAEERVELCVCGGHFRGTAVPRCPRCEEMLSADEAAADIERNAPGTSKGWRWQRSWSGLYAIVIEDRLVNDPWRVEPAG